MDGRLILLKVVLTFFRPGSFFFFFFEVSSGRVFSGGSKEARKIY